MRLTDALYYGLAGALLPLFVAARATPQLRPLTPDDLLRVEQVGSVAAISPGGETLAYVLQRPKTTAAKHDQYFLTGNDRADIWTAPTDGGKPRRITDGVRDNSGFFHPAWSPDGQRMAMLSTRGGNLRLWLWERSSGELRRLSDDGVNPPDVFRPPYNYAWLTNEQLVTIVLAKEQKPISMVVETQAAERAMEEWPKSWKGQEPTASVLDSGQWIPLDQRPQSQLLMIDVKGGGGSRVLDRAFGWRELYLSPDRRYVFVMKQVDVMRPDPKRAYKNVFPQIYRAVAFDQQGSPVLPGLAKVNDVQRFSASWSPDGSSLALIGRMSESRRLQAVVCTVEDGECQGITKEDMEPAVVGWAGNGKLLIRPKTNPPVRDDWWLWQAGRTMRNLTEKMKTPPVTLVPEADKESVVALAAGGLWRIPLEGSAPENLTGGFDPRITSIVWPNWATPAGHTLFPVSRRSAQIVFAADAGNRRKLYRLDLSSSRVAPIATPNPAAAVMDINPENQAAVFQADDRTGSYLWVALPPYERFTTLLETNSFLRDVAQAEFKKIEYRGADGQNLIGWVMLPIGYQEGTRYPMITNVYIGQVFGDSPPRYDINHSWQSPYLNYQLLAAHGYAVLFPSMPLPPVKDGTETSDPYIELPKGVLPAIDKAIEMGIADPKRLGVTGQSFGGYSTLGLITQTNRFQAAVSTAGFSDLLSWYGSMDTQFRYDDYPLDQPLPAAALEDSNDFRFRNPPWKDVGRYLRNSPISYVDRVETPVLIIHGDMDFLSIQQSEEYFLSLYRQNKRARFIRYWGEGHVLDSPANVRDMWKQIYVWFDEHLKKPPN